MSLLCFRVILFREQLNFVLKGALVHVMSFYCVQISFERFYYTLAEEADKLFRARLEEKAFSFVKVGAL